MHARAAGPNSVLKCMRCGVVWGQRMCRKTENESPCSGAYWWERRRAVDRMQYSRLVWVTAGRRDCVPGRNVRRDTRLLPLFIERQVQDGVPLYMGLRNRTGCVATCHDGVFGRTAASE